jgi:hypothetical protein
MQMMVRSDRLAWGLPQLSVALGLSLGFLRKEARCGRLRTKRIGRRVLVLDADVKRYLKTASRRTS